MQAKDNNKTESLPFAVVDTTREGPNAVLARLASRDLAEALCHVLPGAESGRYSIDAPALSWRLAVRYGVALPFLVKAGGRVFKIKPERKLWVNHAEILMQVRVVDIMTREEAEAPVKLPDEPDAHGNDLPPEILVAQLPVVNAIATAHFKATKGVVLRPGFSPEILFSQGMSFIYR